MRLEDESEIQKPLTGRPKCVMRPGQGQKSQSLEWEETKREILDSAFRQNFDEISPGEFDSCGSYRRSRRVARSCHPVSASSGARDEFHLAAIVQNLKTLALRTLASPSTRRRASLA